MDKKTYQKPIVTKRETLSLVTAAVGTGPRGGGGGGA